MTGDLSTHAKKEFHSKRFWRSKTPIVGPLDDQITREKTQKGQIFPCFFKDCNRVSSSGTMAGVHILQDHLDEITKLKGLLPDLFFDIKTLKAKIEGLIQTRQQQNGPTSDLEWVLEMIRRVLE
jgi:hypothetical protein